MFEEFVGAFDGVDELVMAEIYEVEGRNESDDISSQQLVDRIKDRDVIENVFFASDYNAIEDYLRDHIRPGDLLIFMGAGTIDNIARKLV
ncbi:MAG: UDP-N-acetylmuramate-L-alanine ligase [Candidatus Uhrbacteria bacterium GW2011_GWE2_41_1153]|nr:MAG: UDP-N-acetylmuramate-L-alanine ligase [Candidatus Uhrbacteria bacterium GW2011_GWE2_41_1153]